MTSWGGSLSNPVREYVPGGTVVTFAIPTKIGYTFKGWFTDSGYTSDEIFSTEYQTNPLYLYAKFEINQYTVDFDNNGGDGGTVADIEKDFGETVTVPDYGFTRTGYTQIGWNTEADEIGRASCRERV